MKTGCLPRLSNVAAVSVRLFIIKMMMMVMMVMVMITLMNKIMIIKDEDRQSNFYKVRKNFGIEDNIRGMKIN